jgi:hypothetical protein
MEIDELYLTMKIVPWQAKDSRHYLFLQIKYPNTKFYKGSWGQELLHFVDDGAYRGQVGKIYCSYDRYKEIAKWFLNTMYDQN